MNVKGDDDLALTSKKIPASILKKETGKKGSKEELIAYMRKHNPERLAELADYYDARKNSFSGYVFRVPKTSLVDFSDPFNAIDRINSDLRKSDDWRQSRLEVVRISRQGHETLLRIRYESEPHTDRLWEGDVHIHKKERFATLTLRLDLGYVAFRTRGRKSAENCMGRMSVPLFGDPVKVQIAVARMEDHEVQSGKIKSRRAVIENIKLPGTKRITLSGENVQRTLVVLRDSYKLDFGKLGSDVRLEKSETHEQVRFEPDGRVVIPGRVTNREAVFKKVL